MLANSPSVKDATAKSWVDEVARITKPREVIWLDGSKSQYQELIDVAVGMGTLIPLNPQKRPSSYLARSHPRDVARMEDRTFVCTPTEAEAGPNNNWREPKAMREKLLDVFSRCMQGRVMYVIPFVMGPVGSPFSRAGLQVTDSPYVAASMTIMTRVVPAAFDEIAAKHGFVRAWHSVGAPLAEGETSDPWPHNDSVYVAHFPQESTVMSFGSGYGGNALLAKKCFALRLASYSARAEGWLAEHMLIVKVTDPEGNSHYLTGAFPSACGKTNLAMMRSHLPGWQVQTIGDDIAWIHVGDDGRLWAINPESGFFGVAPGTSSKTNPVAIEMLASDTIFTNTALTADGDVWWEGLTDDPPSDLIDWRGAAWSPDSGRPAAHPNARFTVATSRCSEIAPEWNSPAGVPISAMLVGGRRPDTVPLVNESLSWEHGVFLGASMSSAQTAAAEGEVGVVRRDPFAMLPFCGYDLAQYWQHWLDIPRIAAAKTGLSIEEVRQQLPKIFQVNWFQVDEEGRFIWPGFAENLKIVIWALQRAAGSALADTTPLGLRPPLDEASLVSGEVSTSDLVTLLAVDVPKWSLEADRISEYFETFGNEVPAELGAELQALRSRLAKNPS
jgi:phosphoenolpyruvate carboxykinase (GTP)